MSIDLTYQQREALRAGEHVVVFEEGNIMSVISQER